jgi:starch synthase (maltosyl-transferring)
MATPRSVVARDTDESNELRSVQLRGDALAFPTRVVRPIITSISPQVDGGHRPAKVVVGDQLRVTADVFVDGHDAVCCEVRFRHESESKWLAVPMSALGNDRWLATLPIRELGRYRFVVRAAVDHYETWRRDLAKRLQADQDVEEEFLVGANLIQEGARRAKAVDRRRLLVVSGFLRSSQLDFEGDVVDDVPEGASSFVKDVVFSEWIGELMRGLDDPVRYVSSDTYFLTSDPVRARFSSWYEMFPRSAGVQHQHGTFSDVEAKLEYVEKMGFDVLYLPPIHPIGSAGRKGVNGATTADASDPGSPWAIGSAQGGHTAVHPELGTLSDFRRLVLAARTRGIDVALDVAFQASPDHPWVQEHPDWFHHLPNGTIRYAENPPKRYEDIYPLDFEGLEWRALWHELLDVVLFWIAQGVKIFRVDNPHTKPFAFWEWLIASVKAEHPETIFLSEAFTRPRVMEHLAKIGFTQSYTYFTWRSAKWEIESYLSELTSSDMASYFRPNFWPNTPDILSEELQHGGRAGFLSRLVLASTLSSNYGIYGPAFELQEHDARVMGTEDYSHSEKYEIRSWDLQDPQSLSGFITTINTIRREHPALHFNDTLAFHSVDNEQLIAYSKTRSSADHHDVIVVVVNLDHHYAQSGWVTLDALALGINLDAPYVMHDLITGARFTWSGSRNYVKLEPQGVPCHIFSLEQTLPRKATS